MVVYGLHAEPSVLSSVPSRYLDAIGISAVGGSVSEASPPVLTNQVIGYARIESMEVASVLQPARVGYRRLATGQGASLQENVNLFFRSGGALRSYWLQNVCTFETGHNGGILQASSNVWPVSVAGALATSLAGQLEGHGKVRGSYRFTNDQSYSWSPPARHYSLPLSLHLTIQASLLAGRPVVAFGYGTGGGGATVFDTVEFTGQAQGQPWIQVGKAGRVEGAGGGQPVVDSADLVFAGAGDAQIAVFRLMRAQLRLSYADRSTGQLHSFPVVLTGTGPDQPQGLDFSMHTAEAAANLVARDRSGAYMTVTAASGTPIRRYEGFGSRRG